jgi:hypothetical protein
MSESGISDFKLYSSSGQLMGSGKIIHNEAIININELYQGIYLLVWNNNGKYSCKKLLI